jgi:hypothetical protein
MIPARLISSIDFGSAESQTIVLFENPKALITLAISVLVFPLSVHSLKIYMSLSLTILAVNAVKSLMKPKSRPQINSP